MLSVLKLIAKYATPTVGSVMGGELFAPTHVHDADEALTALTVRKPAHAEVVVHELGNGILHGILHGTPANTSNKQTMLSE